MQKLKKFFPVLLAVIVLAAMFVVPAFAQEPTPPPESGEVVVSEPVEPPVFDWAEISGALQTLLTAFLVPGAGFLARWLSVKYAAEKAKLTNEQQAAFDIFLKTCVYAAEQMKLKDKIVDKRTYVIGMAQAWLAANKLDMNLEQLYASIEAKVLQEFPRLPYSG
ncbi:MAG: hypothetical protein HY865_22090 [Chloroflexi bacterium]|nr:hypothetical protein [Chloroflexota bacterium]